MMNLTSPKSPTTVLWTRGVTSDSRMYVARASLEAREGDEKKAMKILQAMVSKDIKELMGLRSMHFQVKIT